MRYYIRSFSYSKHIPFYNLANTPYKAMGNSDTVVTLELSSATGTLTEEQIHAFSKATFVDIDIPKGSALTIDEIQHGTVPKATTQKLKLRG